VAITLINEMMKVKYVIILLVFIAGCSKEGKKVDICVEVNQDDAINCQNDLCAPILLEPRNCSIFDFFPRKVNYSWTSNSTLDSMKYELDMYYSWGNQDNFGEWDDDSSARDTSIIVQDTFHTGGFAGAQPGRWRVRAISKQDTSEWSSWYYFKFLR
jgi:hypothetical protein